MMARSEPVNILRSVTIAHIFHFLFNAGKACLYPFLTLYFRQLGLSATQTGLLIGVWAFLSALTAPAWSRLAQKCNKTRLVLMLSVFCLMGTNLILTLVPPIDRRVELLYCGPHRGPIDGNSSNVVQVAASNATTDMNKWFNESGPTSPFPPESSTLQPIDNTATTLAFITRSGKDAIATDEELKAVFGNLTSEKLKRLHKLAFTKGDLSLVKGKNFKKLKQILNERRHRGGKSPKPTVPTITPASGPNLSEPATKKELEAVFGQLSEKQLAVLKKWKMTKKLLNSLHGDNLKKVKLALENVHQSRPAGRRKKRDLFAESFNKIKEKLRQLRKAIGAINNKTFLFALLVLLAGAVLSSATEKVADQAWFQFLDNVDHIERYGKHFAWASLGTVVLPIAVTIAVDHTPCLLPFQVDHFVIHFYVFALIMGFTFIAAFLFPTFQAKKVQRQSKLVRGIKIAFSDCHSFMYTTSVIILGIIYGGITNFLFWLVQDKGGMEVVMGTAVVVAAISEIFVLVLHRWIIKRTSPTGAIVMALMVLGLRLVYYSFLWTPWAVVPMEFLHGFSYTLIWQAVQMYPDFRINPYVMDRSAQSLIQLFYQGIGFAGGSMLSGFLYDKIGIATLYQGAAVLSVVWCILFVLFHKCVKKKHKVRYAKLLQGEGDQDYGNVSDSFEEDDWLEVALKDRR